MKRVIMAAALLLGLALPASMAGAAPPSWNLTGQYKVSFTCVSGCSETWIHSMTITLSNDSTGAVAGTGSVDGYPGYDWALTGTVSGSDVSFDIEWVSPPIALSFNPMLLSGTIHSSGGMSGTASDALGRTFTWVTTAGAATPIVTPSPSESPSASPSESPSASPSESPSASPSETSSESASETSSESASDPSPFDTVQGETAPPTGTGGGSSGGSTPLFALLVCFAFGGLGLAHAQARRNSLQR